MEELLHLSYLFYVLYLENDWITELKLMWWQWYMFAFQYHLVSYGFFGHTSFIGCHKRRFWESGFRSLMSKKLQYKGVLLYISVSLDGNTEHTIIVMQLENVFKRWVTSIQIQPLIHHLLTLALFFFFYPFLQKHLYSEIKEITPYRWVWYAEPVSENCCGKASPTSSALLVQPEHKRRQG